MSMVIDGSNGLTFPGGTTQIITAGMGTSATAQTWQNLTASRALGTTYTNSTGYPIMICVSGSVTAIGNNVLQGSINGTIIGYSSANSGNFNMTYIVPNGATYNVAVNVGSISLASYFELR